MTIDREGKEHEELIDPWDVVMILEATIDANDFEDAYALQCEFADTWGTENCPVDLSHDGAQVFVPLNTVLLYNLEALKELIETTLPEGTALIVWFMRHSDGADVVQIEGQPLFRVQTEAEYIEQWGEEIDGSMYPEFENWSPSIDELQHGEYFDF